MTRTVGEPTGRTIVFLKFAVIDFKQNKRMELQLNKLRTTRSCNNLGGDKKF